MSPVKELTPAVLKEMTDRQVFNENIRLHKVFANHLRNIVKDGVFFEVPDGSLILEGAVTILVKSKSTPSLAENELLAVSSDGFAYGIIKLGKPKQIDLDQFETLQPVHGITEGERKRLWSDSETLYTYKIQNFKRFGDPLKVVLPKEPNDTIKNVEFKKEDALTGLELDGLSQDDIVNAYFVVITEMDMRGLKRTTNDALDKALAESLRKTVQKQNSSMVVQHHIRGMWSSEERTSLLNELKEVQKLAIVDRKKALGTVFSKFDVEYLTGSVSEIQDAIKDGKSIDAIVKQFLKKEPPSDKADLSRVVNRESFHSGLRTTTSGESLIGRAINSPTSVIQKLDGSLIIIFEGEHPDRKEDQVVRNEDTIPIDPKEEGVEKTTSTSTFIPIIKRDEEERTVTGVVLEPEILDAQDQIYSAEVIKDTAHNFNAGINERSRIGLMHEELNHPFIILESYIAPVDFNISKKAVKKGSWVMTVKIIDDQIWMAVKEKELTGFSIHGIATIVPEKMVA